MPADRALSFLDTFFRKIYPQDSSFRAMAEERLGQLTVPSGALGDLMDLAVGLAGMTRSIAPPVGRKKIVVMVGDHGVAAENVPSDAPDFPAQTEPAVLRGGGTIIEALAGAAGADVCLVDIGASNDWAEPIRSRIIAKKIGKGTANMLYGPAMTRTHAVMAVEAGVAFANNLAAAVDIFGAGTMGAGSAISSAAIAAVYAGEKVAGMVSQNAGIGEDTLRLQRELIEKILRRNRPDAKDGFDVLAKVGGFEIGGVAGLIIGAAANRKPMVVDGYAAVAGAMIACTLEPFVRDYLIFAHNSGELGQEALFERLRCRPLLDLNLRVGGGCCAALALHLVEAAAALLAEGIAGHDSGVSC